MSPMSESHGTAPSLDVLLDRPIRHREPTLDFERPDLPLPGRAAPGGIAIDLTMPARDRRDATLTFRGPRIGRPKTESAGGAIGRRTRESLVEAARAVEARTPRTILATLPGPAVAHEPAPLAGAAAALARALDGLPAEGSIAVRPLSDPAALRRAALPGLLALVLALALPVDAGASLEGPWAGWVQPGSGAFAALAVFALAALALLVPTGRVLRAAFFAGAGAALLGFAVLVLDEQVTSGRVAVPAGLLDLLFGPPGPRQVVFAAALTLPAALWWRRFHPESLGARVLLATGAGVVLFAYLGARFPGLDGTAFHALTTGTNAAFPGDRQASWAAFLPLAVAPLGLLGLLGPRSRGFEAPVAFAFAAAAVLPFVPVVAWSVPAGEWSAVLEPFRAVLLAASALLLAPLGAGHLLAAVLDDRVDAHETPIG